MVFLCRPTTANESKYSIILLLVRYHFNSAFAVENDWLKSIGLYVATELGCSYLEIGCRQITPLKQVG